jgi:hypothetical protein
LNRAALPRRVGSAALQEDDGAEIAATEDILGMALLLG